MMIEKLYQDEYQYITKKMIPPKLMQSTPRINEDRQNVI